MLFLLGYSEIIFLVNKNVCCDPPLELSGSQHVFMQICEKLFLNFHCGVLPILNRRTELDIVKNQHFFSDMLILQLAKLVSFFTLWFSSPDHVRVTDEAWIAKTSKYGPCFFF